jgi:hypothetical protein
VVAANWARGISAQVAGIFYGLTLSRKHSTEDFEELTSKLFNTFVFHV